MKNRPRHRAGRQLGQQCCPSLLCQILNMNTRVRLTRKSQSRRSFRSACPKNHRRPFACQRYWTDPRPVGAESRKCASSRECDRGVPPAAPPVAIAAGWSTRSLASRARPTRWWGSDCAWSWPASSSWSGQAKIEGPGVPIQWAGRRDRSLGDAAGRRSRQTTFQLFETQYADLPMAPAVAAYLFSYAEFVLPICLRPAALLTRFAAAGLLALTMLLQSTSRPRMWWSMHVYWVSILHGPACCVGPGAISIDASDPHHLPRATGGRPAADACRRALATASSGRAVPDASREKRP